MTEEPNLNEMKIQLMRDLMYLSRKTALTSDEEDEDDEYMLESKVLDAVAEENVEPDELDRLRFDLWDDYTRAVLDDVNFLIKELVKSFAEVKDFNRRFKCLRRELDDVKESAGRMQDSGPLDRIRDLFHKAHELYVEIRDEEKLLRQSGLERFLFKYYPAWAVIFTAVWGGVYTSVYYASNMKPYVFVPVGVFGWAVALFACYHFTRWLFTRQVET